MSGNVIRSIAEVPAQSAQTPVYAFDGADLVTELRRLADLFPDETAGCRYVGDDDRPLCIAGRALANLGVPLAVLRAHEVSSLPLLLDKLRIKATPSESAWARWAQHSQDMGRDWHQSVVSADNTYPITEATK